MRGGGAVVVGDARLDPEGALDGAPGLHLQLRPAAFVARLLAHQHRAGRDIVGLVRDIAGAHPPVEFADDELRRHRIGRAEPGEVAAQMGQAVPADTGQHGHQPAEAEAAAVVDEEGVALIRVEQEVFAPADLAVRTLLIADHLPRHGVEEPSRAERDRRAVHRLVRLDDQREVGAGRVERGAAMFAHDADAAAGCAQRDGAAAIGAVQRADGGGGTAGVGHALHRGRCSTPAQAGAQLRCVAVARVAPANQNLRNWAPACAGVEQRRSAARIIITPRISVSASRRTGACRSRRSPPA